jgi:hypothetical protein
MAVPPFNLTPLPPLTVEDLYDSSEFFVIPPDILQLQVDTLNVVEGRVPIGNFSPEYQQKIMNYYRFSANRQNTSRPKVAKMTDETLDLI